MFSLSFNAHVRELLQEIINDFFQRFQWDFILSLIKSIFQRFHGFVSFTFQNAPNGVSKVLNSGVEDGHSFFVMNDCLGAIVAYLMTWR
jgi:hypothetical protein